VIDEFSADEVEIDADYEAQTSDFVEDNSIEVDGVDAASSEESSTDDDIDLLDTVMVLEEHDNALVLAVWEPTGDVDVDAALEELATLDDVEIHGHAAVFTSVHRRLHQRLTDLSA
jgi:hypothetical protein